MLEIWNNLLRVVKEHKSIAGVGSLGIFFLVMGIISLFPAGNEDSIKIASGSTATGEMQIKTNTNISPAKSKKILVDVSGAVRKPGVYSLSAESRIKDAILMAGGISDTADSMRIAQTLNLAAKLSDGAKLYIPSLGEAQVTSEEVVKSDQDMVSQTSSGNGININQAAESELDTLPGIGKVTAEKIIANRPYQSINELTQKKVVGASVFEKIKDKISVY